MFDYSVVIPHKNSFNLLERCISSIPKADNIQIIIVDDNSDSDIKNSVDMSFLERYKNLLFVSTEEGLGAGYARNMGLRYAEGKWLLFADADDFFVDGAWDLLAKYVDSGYDIVYFGIVSVDSKTLKKVNRSQTYNCLVENCDNVNQTKIDLLRLRHDVPWGKMIRRNLVVENAIHFDETRYCNDTMFSTMTGLAAKSIYADKTPFYCVTYRDGSLITYRSLQSDIIRYEVILRKNQLLRDQGYSQYQLSLSYYMRKFLKNGIVVFFQAIILGYKYRANFFVGFSRWGKILFNKVRHRKNTYDLTNF